MGCQVGDVLSGFFLYLFCVLAVSFSFIQESILFIYPSTFIYASTSIYSTTFIYPSTSIYSYFSTLIYPYPSFTFIYPYPSTSSFIYLLPSSNSTINLLIKLILSSRFFHSHFSSLSSFFYTEYLGHKCNFLILNFQNKISIKTNMKDLDLVYP